jgi:hypothetical protein
VVALNKFFGKITWDLVGFSTSALCAVHCIAFPILVLFGSFSSLGIAHNHALENGILLVSAIIGISSLVPSYMNHHRRRTPIAIFLTGFLLIIISRLPVSELWETALTTVGASTIAFAHVVNWKYCRMFCGHEKAEVNSAD